MITQYYRGSLNVVKVVIKEKLVIIYDSNMVRKGISVEQELARDRVKLAKWRIKIKNMTEKEIALEMKKDLQGEYGLTMTKEEVGHE